MKFMMKRMSIELPADAPLRVDEVEGTTVRVLRGRVWITQEGSPDDLFLDAGCGHTFRIDGRALISAERSTGRSATIVFDAPLSVAEPATVATAVKRWLTWHSAPASLASNVWEGI